MRGIANKSILGIRTYVPGKPIEEVKRELRLKEVIKLASNESPFGPSPKVLKALASGSKSINRYPDGECYYLRRALAKKLNVSPDQLIFGNGSDEIIVMAVRAFVSKGDEVVIAKPSFLIYEIASRLAGAKIRSIPLKDFRYSLDRMKKAVTSKTKIVFIGNPDNPAGTYVTRRELSTFMKGVRSNVLVFIDEAYFEYITSKDYPDSLGLLKKYKNIIVTRTFSKMYGLAGLRIGYGIARREVIDLMNRVREPFNINSLAQTAALACLKDQGYYRKVAGKIKAQREYLYKQLKKFNVECRESATNFILIDVKKDGRNVVRKLLKKGVIVRDMSFWGLKSFIRVTIGTEKENKKFIKALGETL